MPLHFEPIQIDRQQSYLQILSACPQQASDYSFVNIWGWAQAHGLRWAWTEDLVFIRQQVPAPILWAPVGNWNAVHWPSLFHRYFPEGAEFVRVPETLASLWLSCMGKGIRVEEDRDQWDYLYRVEDLVALRGNRYHKKMNLVRQFRKSYDHVYREMDATGIARTLDMQELWCTWRDCEAHDTLTAENTAIQRILMSYDRLQGIAGGILTVGTQTVAYTVGERFGEATLLVHFEKADPAFKGAYQAINQMFLQNAAAGQTFVNREQDLGDEGLRRAKMSYHPAAFIQKVRVRIG